MGEEHARCRVTTVVETAVGDARLLLQHAELTRHLATVEGQPERRAEHQVIVVPLRTGREALFGLEELDDQIARLPAAGRDLSRRTPEQDLGLSL